MKENTKNNLHCMKKNKTHDESILNLPNYHIECVDKEINSMLGIASLRQYWCTMPHLKAWQSFIALY